MKKSFQQLKEMNKCEEMDLFSDFLNALSEINKLIPFPLNSEQIKSWGLDILELKPEITVGILTLIINDFKLDRLEWDKNKGIQNIFNAYNKKFNKTNQVYKAPDGAKY